MQIGNFVYVTLRPLLLCTILKHGIVSILPLNLQKIQVSFV